MTTILESNHRIKGIKETNIIAYTSYFVHCRYSIHPTLYIEKPYIKSILRICIAQCTSRNIMTWYIYQATNSKSQLRFTILCLLYWVPD